jgi:hypothetical protein
VTSTPHASEQAIHVVLHAAQHREGPETEGLERVSLPDAIGSAGFRLLQASLLLAPLARLSFTNVCHG